MKETADSTKSSKTKIPISVEPIGKAEVSKILLAKRTYTDFPRRDNKQDRSIIFCREYEAEEGEKKDPDYIVIGVEEKGKFHTKMAPLERMAYISPQEWEKFKEENPHNHKENEAFNKLFERVEKEGLDLTDSRDAGGVIIYQIRSRRGIMSSHRRIAKIN
jgi:hypothetical protein